MIILPEKFDFLNNYILKKLSSIWVSPYFIEEEKMVTNQVVFKVQDKEDIVFECNYGMVDNFFYEDEDVVFTIKEEEDYSPWSNIGGYEITCHLIDEIISEIKLVYDEVSYTNKTISSKILQYPVGVIFTTEKKRISVSRDIYDSDCLHFNDENASVSDFFSFREFWGEYSSKNDFIVKRMIYSYNSSSLSCVDDFEFKSSDSL